MSQNELWTGEVPGFDYIFVHVRLSPGTTQLSLANGALGLVQSMQRLAPDLKYGIADTTVDNLPAKLIESTFIADGTSSRLLSVLFDLGQDRWIFELQGNAADKTIVETFQRAVASIRVPRITR